MQRKFSEPTLENYPFECKSHYDDKNYDYKNYSYVPEVRVQRAIVEAKRFSKRKATRLEFLRKVCKLPITNEETVYKAYFGVD